MAIKNTRLTVEERVMGRVYGMYFLRRFVSPHSFMGLVGVVGLATISLSVSLAHVIKNMPLSDISAFTTFVSAAVLNTQHSVQIALALLTVSLFFYSVTAIRSLLFPKPAVA